MGDEKKKKPHKAFKFRLYPSKEQIVLINKSIGCSRYVFNHFLATWNKAYKETKAGFTYNACSNLLTELKKEIEWQRKSTLLLYKIL